MRVVFCPANFFMCLKGLFFTFVGFSAFSKFVFKIGVKASPTVPADAVPLKPTLLFYALRSHPSTHSNIVLNISPKKYSFASILLLRTSSCNKYIASRFMWQGRHSLGCPPFFEQIPHSTNFISGLIDSITNIYPHQLDDSIFLQI